MRHETRTAFLPAEVSWHNWAGFFTDVPVWQPVVKRIFQETFVSSVERIDAGYPGSCAVFVVDQQFVIKLFPPLFPQDFPREREVYGLLRNRLPAMPDLIAEGIYRDQIDWPYLVFLYRTVEFVQNNR